VGYTPNLSGAVWVGSATQKVKMVNIRIGGRYHDKVFGGQVPGPIWKDAMAGALEGKEAPGFNTVHVPDTSKPEGGDEDEGRPDDDRGNDDKPGKNGGRDPFPGISLPPDFIGGNVTRGQDGGGDGGRQRG
jgi:membrane peptidoglycan carboxypeptidase